jgi:hypothetical protein
MKYSILINDISLGGFAPQFYAQGSYPSFGNKNHAGLMTNIDMTSGGFIQQGAGLANLTNGTQAAAVTTLIKGALDFAVSSDLTFGVGGAKLYSFSSTTVTSGAGFPHTINKAAVTGESGEDVGLYKGRLYYTYNHTNSVGGTTTQFDITNPSGTTFRYTFDGTGTDPLITAITFPVGSQVTINIANADAGNNGTFIIIASGANYFEVDNPAGLAETNKTIAAGSLVVLGGDIGKYDLVTTFDDDWGSTVPSGMGTLVGGVPHQIIVGGNDTMYISNGRYITSYDGTTLIPQALDLPTGTVIQSIKWMSDRLWIAANRTNLTGSNKNSASIFIWDGTTDSWESEIKLMGTVGGLHVKNGVMFLFYLDITSTGGYKLAYVQGASITDVANFTGTLPAFYQITDYKDFILFSSNGELWAFGSGDKDLPVRLFQIADGGYETVGCVVCPFGTPIVASFESSSYKLAKFSGYDVNSSWKSTMFDVTGDTKNIGIDSVRINFEKLISGARVDWRLVNNQGIVIYPAPASGNTVETISFSKLGADTSAYYPLNGLIAENFRCELDYGNGSTSATVQIKSIKVYGSSK